jgi:hypothetical protein
MLVNGLEDRFELFWRKQGWGSTTEEDGVDLTPGPSPES